jgi:hypothetical protein
MKKSRFSEQQIAFILKQALHGAGSKRRAILRLPAFSMRKQMEDLQAA